MKKKRSWGDHYTRQAKKEKYPARSVYKLKEIQERFRLIERGDRVLDLGCAPGSWLLYAATLTGSSGSVVGIDLKPVSVSLPPHVRVLAGDILAGDEGLIKQLGNDFNAVISDAAPATTGRKDVDAIRSYELCRAAISIAEQCLLPGGCFICKIFQGEDFRTFTDEVKAAFDQQKTYRPKSIRKASRETYVIGIGKKSATVTEDLP